MTQNERFELARRLNTHWQYCPRCNKKAISREMRICNACRGVVLFQGDSSQFADERMDHWYMWHRSINGVLGWFDKSYWR